ncbi:hypothetical protein [Frankia sp. CcI49]|uniref:hypothetical protein n=1 Tax=Frankia sp. CcI49 TaxID=1745382 RepID=UPI001304478A|nr:hypothetical protein [Frankia sp. CcI49]
MPGADTSHERICWRFTLVDTGGPWAITADTWPEVIGHLRDVESMTVNEIFSNGEEPGKDYPLNEGFPRESAANKRWSDLELDDQDRVSRIRFGGKLRLYGLRVDNVFHIIWWDREHRVWPSKKR